MSGDWDDDDGEDATVPCPYCRREIHDDSVRCPYCERYISQEDAPDQKSPWLIVAVVLGLAVVVLWILSSGPRF